MFFTTVLLQTNSARYGPLLFNGILKIEAHFYMSVLGQLHSSDFIINHKRNSHFKTCHQHIRSDHNSYKEER